jgi:hypothetical protein
MMERCFTAAFFPLDTPLCGEPGTETGLKFAAPEQPTAVPTEETACDVGVLPEFEWVFLEPVGISFDRKRSGGGDGDRDSLHKGNL